MQEHKPLRVLIVEDVENDAILLLRELSQGGYTPEYELVQTADAMRSAISIRQWDLILSDYSLPGFGAPQALKILEESRLDIPFIIVSGAVGEDVAVSVLKAGAQDFVVKGNLTRLVPAVQRELRESGIRRERRLVQQIIEHRAYYDVVTDLPNRTLLIERLEAAIAQAQGKDSKIALLIIGLGHFSEIAYTLGFQSADQILRMIVPRLQGVLSSPDLVAYVSEGKFAVILFETTLVQARLTAEKIVMILGKPFGLGGLPIDLEASVGIALYPDHGATAENVVIRADMAMFLSKQTGSTPGIYDAVHDQHSRDRLALLAELRHAIEHEPAQIKPYYQPLLDLKNHCVLGVELLVRWRHPRHGLILPAQFIPLVEKTALVGPLTRVIFRMACSQAAKWRRHGFDLTISVNLSARSLLDEAIPEKLLDMIDACEAKPSWFMLEITESALMDDLESASRLLNRLHAAGIEIAVDDFGTGCSSLAYLKEFPVAVVKIDKAFVTALSADDADSAIVKSTIDLGHKLGLKVFAEGVETSHALEALRSMECDGAQGYYISPPASPDEIEVWLKGGLTSK